MTVRDRIAEELAKIDIARLTSEMVQLRSYSFMPNQEQEVAEYICSTLASEGIDASLSYAAPGRPNVIGKIGGGRGPVLMLNGHMDTVPAYDMTNAFEGAIRDGRVFGRGACDMKGPVASMMAAMIALKRAGVKLKGDLVLAAVADEEEAGIGTKALLKDWCNADAVIVGEPTELRLGLGNKGLEWIKVEFFGKKVHGGEQKNGVNAIEMAARFISYLTEEYAPKLEGRTARYLGSASLNIGTITGGDQPSTVADSCTVTFDRRSIPGESVEDVYREINDIIRLLEERYPGFSARATDLFEGNNDLPHLAFCTEPEAGIVKAVQRAAKDTELGERPLVGMSFWTDGGFIANNTDAQCIIIGPGEMAVCHTPEESISIDQLEKGAKLYAFAALEYCGEDI